MDFTLDETVGRLVSPYLFLVEDNYLNRWGKISTLSTLVYLVLENPKGFNSEKEGLQTGPGETRPLSTFN